MSSVLQIPRHISANRLVPFLEQLGSHADAESLDLDFSNLARVTPAGLTLSSSLIDAMGGHLLIASGSGLHIRVRGGVPKVSHFPAGTRFPGTLITMTFPRSAAADFDQMFSKLKDMEIPLRPGGSPISFEP